MRPSIPLAPLLLVALSRVSQAEESSPPDPTPGTSETEGGVTAPRETSRNASEPSTAEVANRDRELEARVHELEQKLEALSPRTGDPSPAASTAVDPDLARAAEADALGETSMATPGDAAPPDAAPLVKMNPDISFILDVGGAWFNEADHYRQGGHAMPDNGLLVQGLELAASASVDPYFRFDTYFQLTEAEVEEAYLTTLALPWSLQARAGLMNAAFGRQNALHLHAWNFANPPLSHTRFMSEEHFRGPGVELSVLMPLPWYLNIQGQAFGTTAELGFNSATFGSSEANARQRIENPADLAYVARAENFLELSADWSVLLGLSEGLGQSQYRPDGRAYLHGGDLFLKWRPISSGQGDFALALTIEYLLRDTAFGQRRLRDHGGYIQFDQQLTRRWMTGLRFDTTSPWKGTPPDPVAAPGWQRRGSLSITFLPTHFSKLRVQGDLGREQDREGIQSAVFLQAEVSAGEHGAHKF